MAMACYGSKIGYQWKHKTDFRSIQPSIWGGPTVLNQTFVLGKWSEKGSWYLESLFWLVQSPIYNEW
jgi:hypothetical protein